MCGKTFGAAKVRRWTGLIVFAGWENKIWPLGSDIAKLYTPLFASFTPSLVVLPPSLLVVSPFCELYPFPDLYLVKGDSGKYLLTVKILHGGD